MSNHARRRPRKQRMAPDALDGLLALGRRLAGCTCRPDVTHTRRGLQMAHDHDCPALAAAPQLLVGPTDDRRCQR